MGNHAAKQGWLISMPELALYVKEKTEKATKQGSL
jgi:hypothetical protein